VSATAPDTAERRASRLASAPSAVAVRAVSKSFRLPHQQYSTLKERALHPFASNTYDELEALNDVSFDVKAGEFFGIVGRNGSGKSTLLKCLAGIYSIDRGDIEVNGRLSPFIELGVGFNPDLTARDNVVINAIMLGLSRREARARFDAIIEFAELEEFVDLKLKNYSSGMSVRLGFSVAIQVDAQVILVDEVLAVGDASFQRKCFEQFDRMKSEGRTILYVTHDMGSVERFCDRGMVLERGRIADIGPPGQITRTYSELNFGDAPTGDGRGAAPARIAAAWCENPAGERIVSSWQGEEVVACFEVDFAEAVDDPAFAVIFRNEVRHTIYVPTTDTALGPLGPFAAGERVSVRFRFDNRLAPSRYTLTPCVGARGEGHLAQDRYARGDDLAALAVEGPVTGGVIDLPIDVEIERS
jgi:ABC-type polysaccharide/polyol phosphate transport system ATPase subunit